MTQPSVASRPLTSVAPAAAAATTATRMNDIKCSGVRYIGSINTTKPTATEGEMLSRCRQGFERRRRCRQRRQRLARLKGVFLDGMTTRDDGSRKIRDGRYVGRNEKKSFSVEAAEDGL